MVVKSSAILRRLAVSRGPEKVVGDCGIPSAICSWTAYDRVLGTKKLLCSMDYVWVIWTPLRLMRVKTTAVQVGPFWHMGLVW